MAIDFRREVAERPSSSAPGESSGTTDAVGVRASVQSTKHARATLLHADLSASLADDALHARARAGTTLPSTPKVSAARMHVVMPGSEESMAVSRAVQSMKRPLGSKSRWRRQELQPRAAVVGGALKSRCQFS